LPPVGTNSGPTPPPPRRPAVEADALVPRGTNGPKFHRIEAIFPLERPQDLDMQDPSEVTSAVAVGSVW
jgi:hypothetical protein